jgi:streptogramin lyase
MNNTPQGCSEKSGYSKSGYSTARKGGRLLACLVAAGLLAVNAGSAQTYATPYAFSTIAGTPGNKGNTDGTNSAASFSYPYAMALGTNGLLFTVDASANTVRQVAPIGTNWVVTTIAGTAGVAGSTDGTNGAALFNEPAGIAADGAGNLYVVDANNTVRKLKPVGTNWVSSTIAGTAGLYGPNDGANAAARFDQPSGIAADAAGNLYVADTANDTIRRVAPSGTNWIVTTIAGDASLGFSGSLSGGSADGTNESAGFASPNSLTVDHSGNLFVSDTANYTIRKITPVGTNWVVTTIAGTASNYGFVDDTNGAAEFDLPQGIVVDASDNVYVADTGNNVIRKVSPVGTNWVVTTLAGDAGGNSGANDGTGSSAQFNSPWGITVNAAGELFVADTGNNDIRAGIIATVPNPVISLNVLGGVTVSWPGFGVLQTNADLSTSNWGTYGGAVSANNGTNSVAFPLLTSRLFFRLTN